MKRQLAYIFNFFILFLLISVISLGTIDSVNAQRSRKKKKTRSEKESALTENERRLTEQLFTEGEKYFILEDFSKSLAFFQKALELDPENAAIHYKIADIYNRNTEFDNALIHAIKAVELGPDNKYYYLLLADIYTSKSDFANAADVYESLINKIPGTEEYLLQAAGLYRYQEKYEEALNCYNRVEEIFGINEQITFLKQEILLKQGNLEEVIKEGEKLIEVFPGEPNYVVDLANKLIANDRYAGAEKLLGTGLENFPDNAMMLYKLAEVYRNTDRSVEAKKIISDIFDSPDFSLEKKMQIVASYFGSNFSRNDKEYILNLAQKIIDYHPEEADAYALMGDLLQNYDSLEASRNVYLKSLAIDPSNIQAWQNVLEYEIRNEEYDSVIQHTETAITLFPNQYLLYYYGGMAYIVNNNHKRAVQLLEQGKKLSTSNLRMLSIFNTLLGDAYYELDEYEKSDKAYEAALDFDPENDHVLNNYSYYLSLRKEKLDLAYDMSARVVKRNPNDATFLDTHAWVLYQMGRYEEAKKFIEKAISQNDNVSGTIIEHYGDILFKLGETNKAVEQWEKARELNVDSKLINKKIADRKLYE